MLFFHQLFDWQCVRKSKAVVSEGLHNTSGRVRPHGVSVWLQVVGFEEPYVISSVFTRCPPLLPRWPFLISSHIKIPFLARWMYSSLGDCSDEPRYECKHISSFSVTNDIRKDLRTALIINCENMLFKLRQHHKVFVCCFTGLKNVKIYYSDFMDCFYINHSTGLNMPKLHETLVNETFPPKNVFSNMNTLFTYFPNDMISATVACYDH